MNTQPPLQLTPLHLRLLLHYHITPETFQPESPAAKDYTLDLVNLGLLGHVAQQLTTTERGKAHIRQLETLPLPQKAWTDFSGKAIQ